MNTLHRVSKRLIVAVVIAAVFAGAAGAETSGTLLLKGSVPGILEISVNAKPEASALDLSIDASNVSVATIIERSNKRAGYTVSVESANAVSASADKGFFVNAEDETAILSYEISFDGSAVTLAGGSAVISDVSSKTAAGGSAKEVAVSYNGATDFPYEGEYSDTLTFTIAAK